VDFVGEALRWWDRWLKDAPTGVEDDPAQRLWLMESVPPARIIAERPGRWIGLPADPSEHVTPKVLELTGETLGSGAHGPARSIATQAACGQTTGEFFPFGFAAGDLPADQSPDDALSLCYETPPLEQRLEIAGGGPVLRLRLSADKPRAQIAARLCDVRPDGSSLLLAHGFLDLRYRDGFEAAHDLVPGAAVEVEIALDDIACAVPAGHRLRLALSPSSWPFIWPERDPATLTVESGRLTLPELTGPGLPVAPMAPPRASGQTHETVRAGGDGMEHWQDGGALLIRMTSDTGRVQDRAHGLWMEAEMEELWSIARHDPGAASVRFRWTKRMGRGDWSVQVHSETTMKTCAEGFEIAARLEAETDGARVFEREFGTSVPR
jgi:hypothetical protein